MFRTGQTFVKQKNINRQLIHFVRDLGKAKLYSVARFSLEKPE